MSSGSNEEGSGGGYGSNSNRPFEQDPIGDVNFPYPLPTINWVPDICMYPGQQPVDNQPNMTIHTADDWWVDAPMPSDSDFRFPSTSENDGESSSKCDLNSSRAPFTPISHNDDMLPSPRSHFNPDTPEQSDIQDMERLNINHTPLRKPLTPEKLVVEVRPRANEKLVAEDRVLNETKPWCTVYYYEMNQRVGKPFYANTFDFTIDGAAGQTTSENRMSLTSQPPSKIPKCGTVRNQVGPGVRITKDNGAVWLTVLSDATTFVQCPFNNQIMNANGISRVSRLQNAKGGAKDENGKVAHDEKIMIKLFDRQRFEYEKMIASNKLPMEKAIELVYSFCTTRISFVKGFGAEYSERLITSVPCWIEIILNEPLEAYDQFVRDLSNSVEIGSRS